MKPQFTISFLAFVTIATFAQEQPDGTWLDSAPVQWNRPLASLPLPAFVVPGRPQDVERNITPDCKAHQWSIRLHEERVVGGAEWLVFASFLGKAGKLSFAAGSWQRLAVIPGRTRYAVRQGYPRRHMEVRQESGQPVVVVVGVRTRHT